MVMAALSDGRKVVVSAIPGYRESIESWSDVLRDMRRRGLECPRLVIGDGHLGIWGALRNVYPQAAEQRCWNHKILNVLDRLPKRQQDQAKLMLRTIPYAQTRTEAERLRTEFTRWCRDHSYEAACVTLERDWDRMITFYDFPKEHWQHLRHDEPGGVTLRCAQTSDRCRQALQEGRSGDSGDLENVDGRRTALQASEGP